MPILLAFFICLSAKAENLEACFRKASIKNDVPMGLLLAISYTESRFKTRARNTNTNGTKDYGLMQINSVWATQAKKMGYSWQKIKSNPCENVMFGSQILKYNHKRMGSWSSAIGAYNAGFGNTPKAKKRRQKYYNLVMQHHAVAQISIKKTKKEKLAL